jgi:hypothetical protein
MSSLYGSHTHNGFRPTHVRAAYTFRQRVDLSFRSSVWHLAKSLDNNAGIMQPNRRRPEDYRVQTSKAIPGRFSTASCDEDVT